MAVAVLIALGLLSSFIVVGIIATFLDTVDEVDATSEAEDTMAAWRRDRDSRLDRGNT